MENAGNLQVPEILRLDSQRPRVESKPMTDVQQAGETGPLYGRAWEATPHRRKINLVAVIVGDHGQAYGSAFCGVRLKEEWKVSSFAYPLELVGKRHQEGVR
jgi:hypothetical protein